MRIRPWKSGAAILSSLAVVGLISGCQTQPKKEYPAAPSVIPKGTLTATANYAAYVYLNGGWEILKGNSVKDQPSETFRNISFAPNGQLLFTTNGTSANALEGNEIHLWRYHDGWQQASVNGDSNITKSAWAPNGDLYAAPDDGTTQGIWYTSGSTWHFVPGSSSIGFITSLNWSPQGTLTVTTEASNGASIVKQFSNGKWEDLNTSSVPFAADGLQVTWSPQGILTLATSAHGIWQFVQGHWAQPGNVQAPITTVTQVGWSPNGNLVVAGNTAKSTGIWTLSGSNWSPLGGASSSITKDPIQHFAWSPQGVLTVSDSATGQILQFKDNKWVSIWNKSKSGDAMPPTFGWSPSGVLTATAGSTGGLWQYKNTQWSEVGGDNSPLKGQQSVVFGWSK